MSLDRGPVNDYYAWIRQNGPAMKWCDGQHVTLGLYEYDGLTYCPEHRPRDDYPPRDAPTMGRCEWQRGHDDEVWLVPKDGRFYCRTHLQRILAIALWKP